VCCECCVLSGRGLCDGLIIRSEESYRLWRAVVCDHETSQAKRLKPASDGGCSARRKKKLCFIFGMSWVEISTPRPVVLNVMFLSFTHYWQEIYGVLLQIRSQTLSSIGLILFDAAWSEFYWIDWIDGNGRTKSLELLAFTNHTILRL